MYRSGRVILNGHDARAAAKMTRFGREVRASLWTGSEYQTLRILHTAGAHVPKALGHTSGAVVMEWIGDAEGPAPQLKEVKLDRSEAAELFGALITNIELWLACNIVHADLYAYNLLCHAGRLVAIDFPQAVDPRFNDNAPSLLARDLGNVCQYFGRFGVESDPNALADDMWDRFIRGCL